MERVGEHPVPAGPLAVRWLGLDVPPLQAGTAVQVEAALENVGTAPWRGLSLSYHWLDERGNPIHWDGMRTPVAAASGENVHVRADVRAPIPPGRYRLAFDLVDEHRFWLAELGNHSPTLEVDVKSRDVSGARAYVPEGVDVTPEWRQHVTAAHAEGYTAVGGSIRSDGGFLRRGAPPELEPYAPGGGRNPAFGHPLVCPSLLPPLEPNDEVLGLPAWRPTPDEHEPWLYDARIVLTLRRRSDRRRG